MDELIRVTGIEVRKVHIVLCEAPNSVK